jgi:hypothetical protein
MKIWTHDHQVQEGNDNINVEDEEDGQKVRDKEPILTRIGRIVKRLEYYVLIAMFYSDDIPQNYSEVKGRDARMEWRKAVKRRAWEIIELPEARKPYVDICYKEE